MVKVTSLLAKAGSRLGFSFGVRAWTEMEMRCVKDMYRLKLVSSGNNSVCKALSMTTNYRLALFPGITESLLVPVDLVGVPVDTAVSSFTSSSVHLHTK